LEDLGSGAFSQVVLARHRSTGALAALKVVFLNNPELDVETKIMLMQEGRLLEKLSHPNLVSCSGVVRSPQAHVIILELLRGCNVLDGLFRRRHKYTERDAAGIFTQIASAVAYLHYHGIIHRDIKPENIVYKEMPTWGDTENSFGPGNAPNKVSNSEETPFVKLVDLGMAWQCRPDAVERGVLGSAGFVAPEIVQGCEHSPSMDIFALGVLLFIMLVGRKPFNINESENLKYVRMQLSDAPGLKDPRWLDLSPDAKSLIMGMLAYDPKRRLTAEQVLAHEWVASGGGRTTRKLGADVAMGAATVAEIRRLRFLCSGAVALQRAAGATAQSKSSKKGRRAEGPAGTAEAPPGQPTTEHIAYLEGLRKQRK